MSEESGVYNLQMSKEVGIPIKTIISNDSTKLLNKGIREVYEPEVRNVHKHILEIIRNQGVLCDSIEQEFTQLEECVMLKEVAETFEKVKEYQKKLVFIKKESSVLLDRIQKTKVRAQKLQYQKEQNDLDAAREKEKNRIYESELVAKLASSAETS
uniref:Biogenesis of lysosome-related organelles complex 1 subunit 6 n=1 Tax=Hydra vulgaris TaxID=6087 RepID=T2M3U0_HYDVU|nr:uncharacterized protein LOC101238379 [Hydra vulgaris]